MSDKATEIARQLSKDKGASGSKSVAEVAKGLNEGVGKPLDIGKTRKPLEGSGKKGKRGV